LFSFTSSNADGIVRFPAKTSKLRSGRPSVAIIGGGIAGLSCAQSLLASGYSVTVFEKGRRPGGRVSTRRANGFVFDHGAQYFTAEDREFLSLVDSARRSGLIAPWEGRIESFADGAAETMGGGRARWVGIPGMSALARHLALGLDVRLGHRIAAVEPLAPGWRLLAEDGGVVSEADLAVVAIPAPQAVSLLVVAPQLAARAAETAIEPCWAVLAGFSKPIDVPFDGAFLDEGPLAWICRDRSKPGRGFLETWVLHASAKWSRDHLEGDQSVVCEELLAACRAAIGVEVTHPAYLAAHRWRYARVETPIGETCLFDPDLGIGACGDWCLGSKIEAAFLSGRAMAQRLASSYPSSTLVRSVDL
jgi:renalase